MEGNEGEGDGLEGGAGWVQVVCRSGETTPHKNEVNNLRELLKEAEV